MQEDKTLTLLKENAALIKELTFARIDSIEKSIAVAHEDLVRVPTDVQNQVAGLKELLVNKIKYENKLTKLSLAHIQERFEWIEAVRKEQKQDTKLMVDAALAAQEKAFVKQNDSFMLSINKSETSTNKQIEGLDNKIADLKDRQNRNDGQSSGRKDFWGYIVGASGIIAVLITLLTHK